MNSFKKKIQNQVTKGETTMKRHLKVAVALGLFALGFIGEAAAFQSTETIVVYLRPNAFYAVEIATGNVNLDLGSIDLGVATQTVRPATVTVRSTFALTEYRLRGDIATSGGTAWTFDDNTVSSDSNKLAAWVTFTSTTLATRPTQTGDYFSGSVAGADDSDVLDASERYVGSASGADRLYEATGETGAKVMDNLSPNDPSHMWLYFRMPSASTSSTRQDMTLFVTALTPVN